MNRQTAIIALIAVVLVVLLLIFEKPFKGPGESKPAEDERLALVKPISEDEVSRIEISSGIGTSVTLVRKGRQWFVGRGHKADGDAIRELIQNLSEIKNPELVSINPEAHMKFRVHSLVGKRIKVFDMTGEPRIDLIVGETEREFFSVPVRMPDSDNVYRVKSKLKNILTRRTWRDENILRLKPDSIKTISVVAPDESYTLSRSAGAGWAFTEPTSGPADVQQVQNLLARVSSLRCAGFAEATEDIDLLTSYGLVLPNAAVTVGLDDGSSYTVAFGAEVPSSGIRIEYYAKRMDEPQVYEVAEPAYNGVIRQSVTLKPLPEPVRTPSPLPAVSDTTTATLPADVLQQPTTPTSPAKAETTATLP